MMKKICPDKRLEGKVWTQMLKAIEHFSLIKKGDRVIVAVSGGKDSLTMLYFLHLFKKRNILDFDLVAVHIITNVSLEKLTYKPHDVEKICKEIGVKYEAAGVDLSNPKYNKKGYTDCYWCSTQKRRLLFAAAEKHKCNKIAFGHHKDDIVITNFMNAFYLSNLETMKINHSFFDGKYHIIRPLCFLREKDIERYARIMEIPATCNCCRVARDGRREQVTEIVHNLEKSIPEIVESVFWAFVKNNDPTQSKKIMTQLIQPNKNHCETNSCR